MMNKRLPVKGIRLLNTVSFWKNAIPDKKTAGRPSWIHVQDASTTSTMRREKRSGKCRPRQQLISKQAKLRMN